MTNHSFIQATNLSKRFDSITAVNRVSFSIRRGEIFGFLGPNGAGKTTTIRMLIGLLTPDEGTVQIDGQDVHSNPIRSKLRMGVIPELGNVYVDLSALENVVLAGRFYGYPTRELRPKAEGLLKQFELQDRGKDPVRTFSKGMMQRVNIASALVHNPEILFLDEPTSGLDVKSQRLIKEIIRRRNRQGTTVVLTTHNIEEANTLCDRVCIIKRGTVVAVDSPEALKKAYESVQSVDVCFDRPIGDPRLLQDGWASRVEKRGDKWKLYTSNPDQAVRHIVALAEKQELVIEALAICGASLEDIFVALTEVTSDD